MPPSPSSPFSRSVTKATALSIARWRVRWGNQRIGRAQQDIDALEEPAPGGAVRAADPVAYLIGGRAEQLRHAHPARVARAAGARASSTSSGTITVRDQYDTLLRWNGNHSGRCMISTGITGTARHGTWPNSASWARVNTLARSAPPAARMAVAGAFHVRRVGRIADQPSARNRPSRWHEMSNRPPWNSGQPPCSPWRARR